MTKLVQRGVARRLGRLRIAATIGAVTLAAVATACAAPGSAPTGDPAPNLVSLSATFGAAPAPGWKGLVDSQPKFFGLSIPGVPTSLTPLKGISSQLGAKPDLVEYYQDWSNPFDPVRAERACDAGIVPVLTWESWSWEDIQDGAPAFRQPAYAPRLIAAGKYDDYIRASARAMKALNCPLMLRFDQEPNGYWYPWGLETKGMHNTAAQYVLMWRHVERIFRHQHVHNVAWCWSPNVMAPSSQYSLSSLYPGDRYVDTVGLDGYLWHHRDTPHTVYGPLMQTLETFASKPPWFISETGVLADRRQAHGIRSLLHAVGRSKRLEGLVYLDQSVRRADWTFTSQPASVRAFRRGLHQPEYRPSSPIGQLAEWN